MTIQECYKAIGGNYEDVLRPELFTVKAGFGG